MKIDLVLTAIIWALVLLVWFPWKLKKCRHKLEVTKIRIRAHLFAIKYSTLKSLSAKPKQIGEAA